MIVDRGTTVLAGRPFSTMSQIWEYGFASACVSAPMAHTPSRGTLGASCKRSASADSSKPPRVPQTRSWMTKKSRYKLSHPLLTLLLFFIIHIPVFTRIHHRLDGGARRKSDPAIICFFQYGKQTEYSAIKVVHWSYEKKRPRDCIKR